MDKRIKYRIVIDTETCPIDNTINEVTPQNMLTYDCGWAVVDKRGKVYKTRSFINTDIFFKEKNKMQSAYYANKIPKYLEQIENGTRETANFYTIRQALLSDIAEYNVDEIYAHNMRFDLGTLNTTLRYITDNKYRYFFPRGIKICDTLKMSRDVIGKMPTYKKFCKQNNFMTKNNQCRFTAEILYRFITKDLTFEEEHTGLEDVMIEKEILAYCYRQHKKMRRVLYE